jgi:hypothetical protein
MRRLQPLYDACCIANGHDAADISIGRIQHGITFFLPVIPCRPFPLEGFDSFVGPLLCRASCPAFFCAVEMLGAQAEAFP